ncbi:inward rectifier potassium channel [Chitinophaga sp. CF118]|uniref:ion channel n=1 Tax=Chitinophaga sp. CF118 TaxID=1884367 RepID=UPI0008E54A11|nr:ion channel [Chitinophaga sp. CF118]SFE40666.1 inward rectifier potassium channel [Chitinophaga sp. CF118]
MPLLKRINPFLKTNEDTGFSTTISSYGGRFVNKDGTFNLRKEGRSLLDRYSIYQTMLNLPVWQFTCMLVLIFIILNLLYTSIYLMIGTNELQGIATRSTWGTFKEVYFFSTETFTTVGYGRVNPIGDGANFVASIEAMSGFLSFALATGLIYGRFARPKAYLAFSDHAVIAPFKQGTALMFRFACYKNHHALTDVNVQVNIAMLTQENGHSAYKYFDLKLERSKIESLPMNWTVVHPLNEESPLSGLSAEDMQTADVEIYVLIRGFSDIYSSIVQQRTSYTYQEIRFNKKFVPMYRESGNGTVLELQKLNKSVASGASV